MSSWRDVEATKEYRKELMHQAAQWRLAHQQPRKRRQFARIQYRTLAWLGYRLLVMGVQLLNRYSETGPIPSGGHRSQRST